MPAEGSAYGRAIRVKSGLGRGLAMVENTVRWSSGLRTARTGQAAAHTLVRRKKRPIGERSYGRSSAAVSASPMSPGCSPTMTSSLSDLPPLTMERPISASDAAL